jgi:hypothetical protein
MKQVLQYIVSFRGFLYELSHVIAMHDIRRSQYNEILQWEF